MTEMELALIGDAMEAWLIDENVPEDISFDDWVKLRRPEIVSLLDKIPPPRHSTTE